jgi:transposase-like protein
MLGLDEVGHKMTPEMAAKVAYAGQMAPSFEAAEQGLDYLAGLKVSASLIRQVTEETGNKVHKQQMEEAEQVVTRLDEAIPAVLPHEQKPGTLYVMADGSQVNTREQGQDGSSWREMKLGLVYSDDHVITRKGGQSVLVNKEYVTYFGGVDGFKKLLFNAAIRARYGTYEKTVVVGDGAHWIWNLCDELFPDAIQVLDYYHLSENVYNYAKYLYPSDNLHMTQWAKDIIAKIEKGELDEALATIPAVYTKLPAGVTNLRNYLSNNRKRMNYSALKKEGIKVGSGAVESGNKKVIQQRMKQSGMRWNIDSGQSVASLRAKHASGRWRDVERILNAA